MGIDGIIPETMIPTQCYDPDKDIECAKVIWYPSSLTQTSAFFTLFLGLPGILCEGQAMNAS